MGCKIDFVTAAEYVCIAAHQVSVTYSTNEYGEGPKVTIVEEWETDDVTDWRGCDFLKWLQCKDVPRGMVIGAPMVAGVFANMATEEMMVEFVRTLCPSEKDFVEYAERCGCTTIEEAEAKYGELSWASDCRYVVLKGTEVREFLHVVVPYCWSRNI